MIAVITYALIAILIIVVAVLLARERQPEEPLDAATEKYHFDPPGNGQFLKLSDRIFDSGDFLWLRDEVRRADLAQSLARHRRQLAVRWLEILRNSFNEVVRTPGPATLQGNSNSSPGSWGLLWLTLRFHLLLAYAMFVVRTFGPYHRLLPMLGWRRLWPESASPKRRLSTAQ